MKTLENLVKAFIGESVARNRYTFYAKVAKEEGYVFVSRVFLETAENEKEHAEVLLEFIQKLRGNSRSLEANADIPIVLNSTVENLKISIEGEHYENTEMYPEFAKVAEEEELYEIAGRLRSIAQAEKHHEERFKRLLGEIENGTMFRKDEEVEWICLECGYIHRGTEPPKKCPSCGHPQSYYVARELLAL
ncbi:rubrerythrin [Archaeoglobus veneficus]|uniref:Rubrerythrin n=1 Tax=Archaeoglobus veneficus (strain DSM 11195 / SNP6) TaxID=693661 RepID=F2KT43_ARCVS|nr:rubrerythrin family protein [Archaeoglobus veneficus]AEA47073.1 Rubrerythrin [Archaeoglobus veneficus SNP6]